MTSPAFWDKTVLAINAAEDRIQAVLGSGGELICSREVRAPARGITVLPQAAKWCLETAGKDAADLDGVACVRGPGAFTGLRIALSYTLGLSRGRNIATCGLDYLPLVAAAPAKMVPSQLWVVTHARINTVYMQGFIYDCESGLREVSPPRALFLEQARGILDKSDTDISLVGSGLRRNREYFEACLPRARFLDRVWDKPSADILLQEALCGEYSREPIEPGYMRPSDAESDLGRIAAKRGVDPDKWRRDTREQKD